MSSDPIPWAALAGAAVSAVVGALCAGADTAVTSLSSTRLGALIDQSSGRTRAAYQRIQKDDAKLRSRYLMGRVASTAVTAICFTLLFAPLVDGEAPYLSLAATLVLTVTLFEISTTFARGYADAAAEFAVRFLRPLELLMAPFAVPFVWLAATLGRKHGEKPADLKVTEAEVEALVEEGERSGLFDRMPAEMIRNVLEFGERTAREVMIPRSKVEAIEIETPIEDVVRFVTQSGHSRYPIYRNELDNIVGLLYAKDLFKVLGERPATSPALTDIIRSPANFVAESQLLSSLLREMKGRRQHLAVVVDEFGGVSGIVTLEDVLEEIVGEIGDEAHTKEATFQDLGDGHVVADAGVTMRELGAYLGTDLSADGEYESIDGMLRAEIGKVPVAGTAVNKFGMDFIVRDADAERVGKVEIVRRPSAVG